MSLYKNDKKLTTVNIYIYICIYIVMTKGEEGKLCKL